MSFVLRRCRFWGVSPSCIKLDFLTLNLVSSQAETTQLKIKRKKKGSKGVYCTSINEDFLIFPEKMKD